MPIIDWYDGKLIGSRKCICNGGAWYPEFDWMVERAAQKGTGCMASWINPDEGMYLEINHQPDGSVEFAIGAIDDVAEQQITITARQFRTVHRVLDGWIAERKEQTNE